MFQREIVEANFSIVLATLTNTFFAIDSVLHEIFIKVPVSDVKRVKHLIQNITRDKRIR